MVGTLLIGPGWLSPESAGIESASEPAALSASGMDGQPGTSAPEASRVASTAETVGSNGQPAATAAAAAPTGAAARPAPDPRGRYEAGVPAPEREVASLAAASSSSTGAPEPVLAASAEPDAPAAPTWAGAKVLYYPPAQGPVSSSASGASSSTVAEGNSPRAGIKYRILQRGDAGNAVEVDPDTMFQSGDRIRFAFEPNVDGFLYVIQQGSTGRWSVLLPHPMINEGRNAVTRFEEVAIPPEGWFRFDDNPGAERVFVYLSKEPMGNLPWGGGPVVSAQSVDQPTMIELANSVRSRDLVFEKDDAPGSSDLAGYVVNRDDLGSAVAWTVELHHR